MDIVSSEGQTELIAVNKQSYYNVIHFDGFGKTDGLAYFINKTSMNKNLHAALCGSRRRVTASGDPVG